MMGAERPSHFSSHETSLRYWSSVTKTSERTGGANGGACGAGGGGGGDGGGGGGGGGDGGEGGVNMQIHCLDEEHAPELLPPKT